VILVGRDHLRKFHCKLVSVKPSSSQLVCCESNATLRSCRNVCLCVVYVEVGVGRAWYQAAGSQHTGHDSGTAAGQAGRRRPVSVGSR